MAIKALSRPKLNAVELVSRADDAVDLKASDYDKYIETLDQAHLKFIPGQQPTRFLLNFEFSGKEAEAIKNATMAGRDDDGGMKLAYGSWQFRVAKSALKDIMNPPDLPVEQCLKMRKDDRGLAHDDLVGELDKHGIVQDIFSVYIQHVATSGRREAKNS